MSAADLARLSELLEGAQTLEGAARQAFIERETGSTPWLREELEFFLRHSQEMKEYLERPVLGDYSSLTNPPFEYAPGSEVNGFKILRILGRGGIAIVYLARQLSLDRVVAIKACRSGGAEAKTLAHLEHDHIVKVFSESFDEKNNLRLICMPVVAGASLEEIINELERKKKRNLSGADWLEVTDALSSVPCVLDAAGLKYRDFFSRMNHLEATIWMTSRLADALAYAHERSVLHLDVKPGNILFNQYGRPFLTDFNVSWDARRGDEHQVGGTREYMAPEHVALLDKALEEGKVYPIGPEADIFSLTLTTKRALAVGEEPPDTFLSAILEKGCHPDPEKRFRTPAHFAHELQSYLELRRIRLALPKTSLLDHLAEKYPLTTLTFVGAIPQILASVVCLYYNAIHIVGRLTPDQMDIFLRLGKIYLPTVFTLSFLLWGKLIYPAYEYLRREESSSPQRLNQLRKKVLKLPFWGFVMTSLGWIPSGFFFPFTIHVMAGKLSYGMMGHFAVVFLLGWSLSLAYSLLLNHYVTLRFLYPRFFSGNVKVSETATRELSPLMKWVQVLHSLAIIVPIAGAAILLIVSGNEHPEAVHATRNLVLQLLALATAGVFFALHISRQVTETLTALTNPDGRRRD